MGLSGFLSPDIANLTGLTNISFAHNRLGGSIPNLSNLRNLQRLHLQENQLSGSVPETLGTINTLREISRELTEQDRIDLRISARE
ncbi:disease resistance protein BAK6-like isoform X2 [Miscanthus floridulus]|uniref:disease resistance protein BAK6-like isoform X2 n=1 Tax=Miscanthus floridulus TaxID=154761 RepID=UPI003459834B